MSYHGGRLVPWFDAAPNHRFLERAADAGAKRLVALVKKNTPVDEGTLRESIQESPTVVLVDALGRTVYQSGAWTDVEYAAPIEHGWGLWGPHHAKYEIKPKDPDGFLHWVNDAGEDVFAKRVMHPGAPGQHMFAIGVAVAEAEFDSIVAPHLTRWAREVERQNHSGLGRRAA